MIGIFIPANDSLPIAARETDGSMESLQDIVDGLFQFVDQTDISFVFNEEGKVKQMPANVRATAYLYSIAPEWVGYDVLVGDVLILGEADEAGESTSVPGDVLRHFDL